MLPGFRSLFVAVVLAISMLVFGLGAAALLRATHEEFASLPLKQMPEVTFGSKEAEQPTLATLQVDTPAAEPAALESHQAEAQSTADTSDAQPESGAGAPAADALPATDAPAAPADNDAPAAFPPPSDSVPATADTTPPANTAAPEPSEPAPGGETPVKAGEAVKPPVAKSDASSTDGKSSDVTETMMSPSGEHFKPPLPSHRPAGAAQAADPAPSATKRSSAKEPRATRRHPHRHPTRHSHR